MLAAVDLGSNSFRLHVGHFVDGACEVVRSAREPTRIATGLDASGALNDEAMRRSIDALRRLGDVLQAYPLGAVRAVATNTLRIATNAPAFIAAAEKALGFPIQIISGEEEARLIYQGIAHQIATRDENRLVIDIGGGSTELILGRGLDIESANSVSLGTVWQSRRFFPGGKIDEVAFLAAVQHARSCFAGLFEQPAPWKNVFGSSGTMRAIGEIIARNQLGDEGITTSSLEAFKQRLLGFGRIDRIALEKVRSERAESIVGGLSILIGLMQELGIARLRPVEGGLRLGVLWEMHLQGLA